MVKQTAPSNEASGSDISVASSRRTVTLVPAIRADNEPARAWSISTQVSFDTRLRSKSVVTPGPGPISRTFSPRSIPASDHGKSCVSTVRRHPGERHSHRCTRFISSPSRPRIKYATSPVGAATPPIRHTVAEKRHASRVAASNGCTHRDELFGGGRVNSDGRVKLCLGRVTFESDRQSLDDLARVHSDHVAADHAISFL